MQTLFIPTDTRKHEEVIR